MIWDLAGQSQFQRLWPDYLTDSRAGIIVYDITNRESFENVKKWHKIITEVAFQDIVLILVGNKVDLDDSREISMDEAMDLAKELGIYYMETSAKTNENIDDLFEWIALQIINMNIEAVEVSILDNQTEEKKKFVITSSQLNDLNQFFSKQLEYCIGKNDTKEIIKHLDILKSIEKNQF
jgi:GTPase SAR1 family protein